MISKIDKTLLSVLHEDKVEYFDSYTETQVVYFPKAQKAVVYEINSDEFWYDADSIEDALNQYNAAQTSWWRQMEICEQEYEDAQLEAEYV